MGGWVSVQRMGVGAWGKGGDENESKTLISLVFSQHFFYVLPHHSVSTYHCPATRSVLLIDFI